jgi:hypothetical protein
MFLLKRILSNDSFQDLIVLLKVRKVTHLIVPLTHLLEFPLQILGMMRRQECHDSGYLAVDDDIYYCQFVARNELSLIEAFVDDVEETAVLREDKVDLLLLLAVHFTCT